MSEKNPDPFSNLPRRSMFAVDPVARKAAPIETAMQDRALENAFKQEVSARAAMNKALEDAMRIIPDPAPGEFHKVYHEDGKVKIARIPEYELQRVGDGVALLSMSHPNGPGLKRGRPTNAQRKASDDDIETVEIEISPEEVLRVPSISNADVDKVKASFPTPLSEVALKRKRGRPVADKPWEREGISRMTWYRRKKEAAK